MASLNHKLPKNGADCSPYNDTHLGVLSLGNPDSATKRRVLVDFKSIEHWSHTSSFGHGDHKNSDLSEEAEAYLKRKFKVGHRTFAFILFVDGRGMRLVRWDRSGIIMTHAFNYTTLAGRKVLRNVLCALSGLSSEQAGYDPTATRLLPGDPDFEKMTAVANLESLEASHDLAYEEGMEVETSGPHTFRFVRETFADSLAKDSDKRRYRLEVPLPNGRSRHFLVGSALYANSDCRGTRGFIAWDVEDSRFVWLKDAWRERYRILRAEGEKLSHLREKGVHGVPTCICYADLDQYTEANAYKFIVDMDPVPRGLDRAGTVESSEEKEILRHSRLVLEEVCLTVWALGLSGKQTLSVVRDCVRGEYILHCNRLENHLTSFHPLAHGEAAEKANTLHRDISAGNILVFPEVALCPDGKFRVVWRGILVDWELSEPLVDDAGNEWKALQVFRRVSCVSSDVFPCTDSPHPVHRPVYFGQTSKQELLGVVSDPRRIGELFSCHILVLTANRC